MDILYMCMDIVNKCTKLTPILEYVTTNVNVCRRDTVTACGICH